MFLFVIPDRHFHRVSCLAINRQHNTHFAAPGQVRQQPYVALIQADKISLRACEQDFGWRIADFGQGVGQIAAMPKAGSERQQGHLLRRIADFNRHGILELPNTAILVSFLRSPEWLAWRVWL